MQVLLVEDNVGDQRLMREAFKAAGNRTKLSVVADGQVALQYLRRQEVFCDSVTPNLIILDLNLPGKDGAEVLKEIKGDPSLHLIPVVIFSTSKNEGDIAKCYERHANCYIAKPTDLDGYFEVVRGIEEFWVDIVELPCPKKNDDHDNTNYAFAAS